MEHQTMKKHTEKQMVDAAIKEVFTIRDLIQEFSRLKEELFHDDSFIVQGDSPKWNRYDQLLGLFFPQYRTEGWIDPISN